MSSLLQCVIIQRMQRAQLTILIIDENAVRASIIEDGLREAGHHQLSLLHDIRGIDKAIERQNPDAIIIGIEEPEHDFMKQLLLMAQVTDRPIAMFVNHSDTASIVAAAEAGVSAYVVDGLKKERVKPILDMAVSRFRTFSRLRQELAHAKTALEERKVIERAKGILMKTRGLSEEDAFALLRKSAMNEKRKLAEIARSVVTAATLLI